MNKNLLIGIVVVVIVLVGGFMVFNQPSSNNNVTPGATNETLSGSIDDLLGLAGSKTCTYTDDNSSGTVYFANGRLRGDFQTTTNGQAMMAHMIRNAGYQYVWTDGQGGIKIKESDLQKFNSQAASGQSLAPNLNEPVNYTCHNWGEDTSLFNAPANVQF